MSVRCKSAQGRNTTPLQVFGLGPKFTITCGACDVTFRKRIPMVDEPGVVCPRCGEVNILPFRVVEGEG